VLVEVDKIERKERISKNEEHQKPVFVHWLAERMAYTESNARYNKLEDRNLE